MSFIEKLGTSIKMPFCGCSQWLDGWSMNVQRNTAFLRNLDLHKRVSRASFSMGESEFFDLPILASGVFFVHSG
jgi:hypothetical protein